MPVRLDLRVGFAARFDRQFVELEHRSAAPLVLSVGSAKSAQTVTPSLRVQPRWIDAGFPAGNAVFMDEDTNHRPVPELGFGQRGPEARLRAEVGEDRIDRQQLESGAVFAHGGFDERQGLLSIVETGPAQAKSSAGT